MKYEIESDYHFFCFTYFTLTCYLENLTSQEIQKLRKDLMSLSLEFCQFLFIVRQ